MISTEDIVRLVNEALDEIKVDELSDGFRSSVYNTIQDPERAKKFAQTSAARDQKIYAGREGYNVHALGHYRDIVSDKEGKEYLLSTLTKGIKAGDVNSIEIGARLLAEIVADNSIIVPVPQHSGRAEYTLAMADIICQLKPDCVAVDLLRSNKRSKMYDEKMSGKKGKDVVLGFKRRSVVNAKRLIKEKPHLYLLDNTIASGSTFAQASEIVKEYFGVTPVMLTITSCASSNKAMRTLTRYANFLTRTRSYQNR